MATTIWKGFEKKPSETLSGSYELIAGKKFSKKQPGKPIEVFFHQRQPKSITPDEIDEKTNWRSKNEI